jgi:ankyrin repeat protein
LWELVRDFFWDDSSTAFVEWLGVSPDFDGEWHCVPLPDRQGVQCDRCLFHFQGNHRAVGGLHIAASYGLSDILEWAHPEGLDFEVKSHEGRTPLMYAAWTGELNAAKALLSKDGVHINLTTCKDPNCDGRCATPGRTALVEAVLGHRAEVMRLLLKQPGIEVDYICHRGTALGMVIDDDYQEGVRMLVDAGAKLAMYGGETLLIPSSS